LARGQLIQEEQGQKHEKKSDKGKKKALNEGTYSGGKLRAMTRRRSMDENNFTRKGT